MARRKARRPPPIGEQIRRIRKALGMTQAELAKKIGHQQTHLSRIERGVREPATLDLLTRIATALAKVIVVDKDGIRLVDPD